MLVLRDLADADDGDPGGRHAAFSSGFARVLRRGRGRWQEGGARTTRRSGRGSFGLGAARVEAVDDALIANDAALGPKWRDHPLTGDWADHRECQVGGDSLLIYAIDHERINFVRAGTHVDLF
jgi:mRNA interferase YafQ